MIDRADDGTHSLRGHEGLWHPSRHGSSSLCLEESGPSDQSGCSSGNQNTPETTFWCRRRNRSNCAFDPTRSPLTSCFGPEIIIFLKALFQLYKRKLDLILHAPNLDWKPQIVHILSPLSIFTVSLVHDFYLGRILSQFRIYICICLNLIQYSS